VEGEVDPPILHVRNLPRLKVEDKDRRTFSNDFKQTTMEILDSTTDIANVGHVARLLELVSSTSLVILD
jgi:hypothetical protein